MWASSRSPVFMSIPESSASMWSFLNKASGWGQLKGWSPGLCQSLPEWTDTCGSEKRPSGGKQDGRGSSHVCWTQTRSHCRPFTSASRIYRETESFIPGYKPSSGLMNRAEMANARKTIPPMIVTMEIKAESLNRKLCVLVRTLAAQRVRKTGFISVETLNTDDKRLDSQQRSSNHTRLEKV